MKTIPKNLRVPEPLMKQIHAYMNDQGIPNWTVATLELVRKGLSNSKKEGE